jgi:hypothetical protein
MDQAHLKRIRTSLLVQQQGTISPARLEHMLNTVIREALHQGAKNAIDIENDVVVDVLVNSCIQVGAEAAESYTPARNLPV